MKRLWIVLALAVLTVGAISLWAPEDVLQGNAAPSQATVTVVQPVRAPAVGSRAAVDVERVTSKRQVDAKQREAYLRRIADGVARRRTQGSKDPSSSPHNDTAPGDEGDDDGPGQAHPIKDKSDGELSDLMDAVSKDLMPLVDECYEAAAERDPGIAGLIDINLEMVGDEDVGGIVESFELGEENEIQDEEMIECIRETTLSTLFPAPKDSGRRGARLTLRFEPE
ncbi:MAG: hypothetical protein ACRBN8_18720 [Nannocystales bacterium]